MRALPPGSRMAKGLERRLDLKFTKMQGLGNDYVYVNCFEETVKKPELVAKRISDRHFGVGADGLILICPSKQADCRMEMYNADGSRGAMCGNGIRCVAKYAYETGLVGKADMAVETDSGVRHVRCRPENGRVHLVKVDMGIPAVGEQETFVWEGRKLLFTPVDMGNPHAVFFGSPPELPAILDFGPVVEKSSRFPDGVNVEAIQVEDGRTLSMRVWERGSGETMACGTGACASFAAAKTMGFVGNAGVVRLLGGDLEISWAGSGEPLFMTGPAVEVFRGEVLL